MRVCVYPRKTMMLYKKTCNLVHCPSHITLWRNYQICIKNASDASFTIVQEERVFTNSDKVYTALGK